MTRFIAILMAASAFTVLTGPIQGRAPECTGNDVAAYEAALGMRRGGYRVLPQLGFTIQYLGTENRGHGVCAVLVRRID